MTDILSTGAFVLFVVGSNAQVSTAYFPTREMCEDAVSVALTGMTLAEKKKADADARAEQEKGDEAWAKIHPPRPPKDDFERSMAKSDFKSGAWSTLLGGEAGHVTKDGLIQDDPPGQVWTMIPPLSDAIKTARCFRND